jgi:hypothetical protein
LDSLINAETCNHPATLGEIYAQILSLDRFYLSSGYVIRQLPVVNGLVTVDLSGNEAGKEAVFKYSGEDGNPNPSRIQDWQSQGIVFDGREPNKLGLPIINVTDVFFANFFQRTFSDKDFGKKTRDHGTIALYNGTPQVESPQVENPGLIYSPFIPVDPGNPSKAIRLLQLYAKQQKEQELSFMRVFTKNSKGGRHAENLDIEAVLALNPDAVSDLQIYTFGDRNWVLSNGQSVQLVLHKGKDGKLSICNDYSRGAEIVRFLVCRTNFEIDKMANLFKFRLKSQTKQ